MAIIALSSMLPLKANGKQYAVEHRNSKRGHYGILLITDIQNRVTLRTSCEGRHICPTDGLQDAINFRTKVMAEEAAKQITNRHPAV